MTLTDTASWVRLDEGDIPIYLAPERPTWFVPNPPGDALCRSARVDLREAGPATAAEGDFLRRLPRPEGPPYEGRANELASPELREFWLHVTNRCNLSCSHCLFSARPDDTTELPAQRILDVAREAADMGCRVFALTGGEPMIHPQFEQIVDGLLAFDARVVVLTNGLRFDAFDQALRRWPAERLSFQVSVDGRRQRHDRIRGEGTYDQLVGQLDRLRQRGLAATVSMCVTPATIEDMPAAVDIASELGAGTLHFLWYFLRGRASGDALPDVQAIGDGLIAAARRARETGLGLDNIDALAAQAFAPPGTRHDGGAMGWESLALGPDGRLYPSAALVGERELDIGPGEELSSAWHRSPVLDRIRQTTVADSDRPLRLITGGGDPDHSYAFTGEFAGGDPYLPVYERAIRWLIAERAREAARRSALGDRPGLWLKMGDVLESCGSHGPVTLLHSNCLLSLSSPDGHAAVRAFYTAAARSVREDIVNPVGYPEEMIDHIPPAYRFRGYGCGSPVADAACRPGQTLVDLGCGSGVECFIAARQLGPTGRAIGVDMLDPMLDRARQGARGVADRLGFDNMEFRKGLLERLPVDDASADVVISNCVINLSTDKRATFAEIRRILRPGGRLVVSDVVCEREPDPAIANDDTLRGQCIAGALAHKDLAGLLDEMGLAGFRVHRRFPYRVVRGQPFFSLTFEACRPVDDGRTVRAMYRGPLAVAETARGTRLPAGEIVELPADQLAGVDGEVMVFSDTGEVANVAPDSAGCCSCAPAPDEAKAPSTCYSCAPAPAEAEAPSGGGGSPDPDAMRSAGCCTSDDRPASAGAEGCCSAPASSSGADDACAGCAPQTPRDAAPPAEDHAAGCMLCGRPLVYLASSAEMACTLCGRRASTDAACQVGHFICDTCHAASSAEVIERICRTTDQTDMLRLLQSIRRHRSIHTHGPEHHAMVPGIILATFRNLGGQVTDEMIRTAIARNARVAGGSCGFLGSCGAATGVSAAFGVLLETSPTDPDRRREMLAITRDVLDRLARTPAARCCQRDAALALQAAAELSARYLPIQLHADKEFACEQVADNRECLGPACPLWPK